jgi:hypothetical protein
MSKIDPGLSAQAQPDLPLAAATLPASADQTAPTHAQTNAKAHGMTERRILRFTLFGVILWGLSVAAFGIPGLYVPALAAVPVIWTLLLLITRG